MLFKNIKGELKEINKLNYTNDNNLGRVCHNYRKTFEMNMYKSGNNNFRKKLYKSFSDLNIGREIILYGEKK